MKLVEQHVIDRKDPCYKTIGAAAFASKNLYNAALYVIRQAYTHEGKYLDYNAMDKIMQPHEAYKALPAKVSQQVLRLLDKWYNKRMKELRNKLPKNDRDRMTRQVEVNEESYTSQACFLDLDEIPVYDPDNKEKHVFSGKRIGRRNRLYRAKDGRKICADVNGAYNILRKRRSDAFSDAKGVAAYVVQPVRLAV